MNDVHYIKPRLPIINIMRGVCPHGDEHKGIITIDGKLVHYCQRCVEAIQDWSRMDKDMYYTLYPELRPSVDYTQIKVTLDEADKKK